MADMSNSEPSLQELNDLRRQNDDLIRDIAEAKKEMVSRLVMSELKIEAVRAGIVDLDGLRLVDLSKVRFGEDDNANGAAEMIDELKSKKPWLFQVTSSSAPIAAPPAQPSTQKYAMEMTDAEYRVARANIVKQHRK